MGWLTMRDAGRFATARAYLDDQFTYARGDHRLTVVKSSMVGRPYYAAAERAADGAFGFVLATRDAAHGLSFWNRDYGFGPLFNAIVFPEAMAAASDAPIGDDQPEWLAMPVPFVPGHQP